MKTELLAPAKNKEIALAAIDCGADAIYIGASCFGARVNAQNSLSDIKEVIDYAHKFYVKVYVTVNTILKDEEIPVALELIKELDKYQADAILIQDMGLLNKIIEHQDKISIDIHASTQCDNRIVEKIKFFKDIGLSRVVLARELSLNQIKKIHSDVPDIELEFFVHGALCVSYSGQCYLSNHIGGRSANRGECAQPCRKKYSVINNSGNVIAENIYPLCLKDFNASENLLKMAENGIFSFKIEGRLKDIGYVKNIVSYYRQKLDEFSQKSSSGKSLYSFIPDPTKSFNRGFTDYFLNERKRCYNLYSPKSQGEFIGTVLNNTKNSLTIKTDKKISPQDGLCFINNNEMTGFLVNSAELSAGIVKIYPNKNIKIKTGTKIYRNQDILFEKELLKPIKRSIGIDITVKNNSIFIKDEDGNSTAIEIPSNEIAKNQERMNEIFKTQFSKTGESDFYINSLNIFCNIPFLQISKINELRRSLLAKLMEERLKNYKRISHKKLTYTDFYEKNLNYKANIFNNEAKIFYEKCNANVTEFCPEYIKPNTQYELMRTKHCIKYALNMCKSYENLLLKDETDKEFPLKFDCKNCEMVVLSPLKNN